MESVLSKTENFLACELSELQGKNMDIVSVHLQTCLSKTISENLLLRQKLREEKKALKLLKGLQQYYDGNIITIQITESPPPPPNSPTGEVDNTVQAAKVPAVASEAPKGEPTPEEKVESGGVSENVGSSTSKSGFNFQEFLQGVNAEPNEESDDNDWDSVTPPNSPPPSRKRPKPLTDSSDCESPKIAKEDNNAQGNVPTIVRPLTTKVFFKIPKTHQLFCKILESGGIFFSSVACKKDSDMTTVFLSKESGIALVYESFNTDLAKHVSMLFVRFPDKSTAYFLHFNKTTVQQFLRLTPRQVSNFFAKLFTEGPVLKKNLGRVLLRAHKNNIPPSFNYAQGTNLPFQPFLQVTKANFFPKYPSLLKVLTKNHIRMPKMVLKAQPQDTEGFLPTPPFLRNFSLFRRFVTSVRLVKVIPFQ